MRVLGSAVLGFEAVVVLLGIPVAAVTGTGAGSAWVIVGGLVLMVLLIVGAACVTRPWGVAFGWAMQVLVVASGLLAPLMFVVGGVFALLWFFAVRYGRRADALRAGRAA